MSRSRAGAAGILLAALLACAPSPTTGVAVVAPPAFVVGSFQDDYQNQFEISASAWVQMPHGRFRITKWVPEHSYLIAQNDSADRHAPGLWTRIDWVKLDGMAPWEWAFCLSAYEAPTADSAEATKVARPDTPRTGCNGYPYSRMKRVATASRAAADSAAKQKCREAYASVGADGAGLQGVDELHPYADRSGPTCGTLRRQDPRLRGAE
jgi:hypothetical protein